MGGRKEGGVGDHQERFLNRPLHLVGEWMGKKAQRRRRKTDLPAPRVLPLIFSHRMRVAIITVGARRLGATRCAPLDGSVTADDT